MKTTNEEILRQKYIKENKFIKEIAKELDCAIPTIIKYMKRYGIKSIHNSVRKNLKYINAILTERQKQIIIGTLLGDGGLTTRRNYCRLSLCQGEKQINYLRWKVKELMPIFDTEKLWPYKNKDFGGISYSISSHSHLFLQELREELYKDKKKIIQYYYLNRLDNLGLAVWFMDDGFTEYFNNKISCFYLATECFTNEEHKIICDFLNKKFNLKCNINYQKKKEKLEPTRIRIKAESREHFLQLVSKYIHPCLQYKITDKNFVTF